jgi:hypothetical protein
MKGKGYLRPPITSMNQQVTDTLLMVRPAAFFGNGETAINNHFQHLAPETHHEKLQREALKEFSDFRNLLDSHGIRVFEAYDQQTPSTPDSIFPNNWVTFHDNGIAVLHPMFAANRRIERDKGFLGVLFENGFRWRVNDMTYLEKEGKILEGTGSMVLDRSYGRAYACLSQRTHPEAVKLYCKEFGYEPIIFTSEHKKGNKSFPVYHTNVMMSIGRAVCIVCPDSIPSPEERRTVLKKLSDTGRDIVEISLDQMDSFAGNMLEVKNTSGEHFMIMSKAAHSCLTPGQVASIETHCKILSSSLTCIETHGGGSARCMLAEVFLPSPFKSSEELESLDYE